MTKTKSTKSALMLSALAILLCVSMLVGSTFAWFTDSVASNNNIIKSGNLDAELFWSKDGVNWDEVDEDTNVFTEQLWEPGHTEVVYLKVVNKGTLAFKYNFGVNIYSESAGINVNNQPFKLSDYIKFDVIPGNTVFADRDAAVEAVENTAKVISVGYSKADYLLASKEQCFAMVVYMPQSVENEANYKTGTAAPVINLGINLFATQYTEETDSFGKDYDKDAAWVGGVDTTWYDATKNEFTLDTAEDLAGLAQLVNAGNTFAGKTVKLNADIDLNDVLWTPIGTKSAEGEKAFSRTFAGSFDGQGHTISNLRVVGGNALGLFGRTGTGTHIEDLNIDGAYISGTDYVGAIAGYAYLSANCIKNCTVTGATIIATPYLMENGKYDGGAKAGAIVGYALNGSIIDNTVKESTVVAYRDLGAVAGMLNADGIGDRTLIAEGNKVEEVTLSYYGIAQKMYADDKENQNMNDIVGRLGSKSSVGTNNVVSITKDEGNEGVYEINNLTDLLNFANSINSVNTYAGKTVKLGADIDLNNMEWTPIGTGTGFFGTFDGGNHTISNLKITGNKSTVGLFANTYNGEIKNLTVENAQVSGRLNVGVVAGNPYTSKYTNITVKGHVEVNGFSYVGGVGGKNAYANWTDITVNVDETSYVKAVSTENGVAYRTYVGGVVGFNGEGGHSFKNITSNIDVYGDVCDIGGAFGIAHYGNKFENVTVSGDVYCIEIDEVGGIAGVWNNGGADVVFTNCKFTGNIYDEKGNKYAEYDIVGGAYSSTGSGKLIIDGVECVRNADELIEQLEKGNDEIILSSDVKINPAGMSNAYGKTGINVKNGQTIDGNGHILDIKGAGGTWDSGICVQNGTIKNITVTGSFRGIFIKNNTEKVILENVTTTGTTYTISCDQGENGGLEATNCTFLGWTSFAATVGNVKFTDCYFGSGNGYAYCRPYAPTEFVGCDFEAGFRLDAVGAVTFENCTIGGVALTAENLATLVTSSSIANATVK